MDNGFADENNVRGNSEKEAVVYSTVNKKKTLSRKVNSGEKERTLYESKYRKFNNSY